MPGQHAGGTAICSPSLDSVSPGRAVCVRTQQEARSGSEFFNPESWGQSRTPSDPPLHFLAWSPLCPPLLR